MQLITEKEEGFVMRNEAGAYMKVTKQEYWSLLKVLLKQIWRN